MPEVEVRELLFCCLVLEVIDVEVGFGIGVEVDL